VTLQGEGSQNNTWGREGVTKVSLDIFWSFLKYYFPFLALYNVEKAYILENEKYPVLWGGVPKIGSKVSRII